MAATNTYGYLPYGSGGAYGGSQAPSLGTAPVWSLINPIPTLGVAITEAIVIELIDNDDVNEATVHIAVNGVTAYEASAAKNGFTVQRVDLVGGYRYTIRDSRDWPYQTSVSTLAQGQDIYAASSSASWAFVTENDPTAFTGPLNATEAAVLVPFTTLSAAEQLRVLLLASLVTTSDATAAARALFLCAHTAEFTPVLNGLVTPPTAAEAAVILPRATNLEVSNALRSKSHLLPAAILELQGLGMPQEHITLLSAYAQEDQPNTEVPLACTVILLAKALE